MSAQGCVIDIREHHGIVYRDVKVWSDVHGEPVFGFYTIIDGRLYDVGSSADYMDEHDCPLPISPVVYVPCVEMNAFLASYFDVPCDFPVLCCGNQMDEIIKLKASVGYVWCANWEDFIPADTALR